MLNQKLGPQTNDVTWATVIRLTLRDPKTIIEGMNLLAHLSTKCSVISLCPSSVVCRPFVVNFLL